MTTATILERWQMGLPEKAEDPWFLDWVLRSPKHAGDHLASSYRAFESLRDIYPDPFEFLTVREYFSGIGAHALMLEELFSPQTHIVNDYSVEAYHHLRAVLPPDLLVFNQDSYASQYHDADLAVLDFGDMTVWKAQPGKPHGKLLDSVFFSTPKAVVVTDIAARYLHLQKKSYEPILGDGSCNNYENYLRHLGRHFQERYGYVMHEAHYTRWSAVMAFVPEDVSSPVHSGYVYRLPADYTRGLVLS